jgi:mRNA interferase RelE/StbE
MAFGGQREQDGRSRPIDHCQGGRLAGSGWPWRFGHRRGSALGEVLPGAVAVAAYEFITGPLSRGPYRVGKRLLPPMDDRFSTRRGTYRIIYRIDDKNRVVTVVDVGRRRAVYRS